MLTHSDNFQISLVEIFLWVLSAGIHYGITCCYRYKLVPDSTLNENWCHTMNFPGLNLISVTNSVGDCRQVALFPSHPQLGIVILTLQVVLRTMSR